MKIKKFFELIPDIDAVLIISQKNRLYFSEFSGTSGILVLTRDSASYITDFRYYEMAKDTMANTNINVFLASTVAKSYETAAELLENVNAKTVGFEDTELTYSESQKLFERFSNFHFVPVGKEISLTRQFKNEYEIECITKAQQITDKAFAKVLTQISSGMTEIDLAAELEYLMRKFGADGTAFDTIIASGANSSKPHAHPTSKQIVNGDPITMDFGAKYKGYCSDMTRTVFLGKPSAEIKKIYNIVLSAQQEVLSNIKAGMTGKEVDALARQVIVANGYPNHFNHGLGHSLGIDVHEPPTSSMGSDDILLPNMLQTVEPGIYVSGMGGVRIEDLVVIKEDKIIDLTTSSKEIIIL